MYLEKAINEYLAWKGTYAPRAAVNYRRPLNIFRNVNGNKDICTYDIPDLVKFKNWITDKYVPCGVQFAMTVIHNFFKFWRLQQKSCLSPELIKVGKGHPNSHRAVNENEFKKICAVINEPSFVALRDKLIISMLWDTGIRISELTGLNIEQISREDRKVVIPTKKNQTKRIIVWSEETHDLLYQYLPLRAIITRSSPLFISNCMSGTGRLTGRSIERMIAYYTQKAGIQEKVTPHSFRHGWAHHRLDKKASLPFIQRGLGHRNPMSTHVYLQYTDKDFETQALEYL